MDRRLATKEGSLELELRVVRTGVLVLQGESKVIGVTGRVAAAAELLTHFVVWLSTRFLDARASWSSRRRARFSSSKAAISRFSVLIA